MRPATLALIDAALSRIRHDPRSQILTVSAQQRASTKKAGRDPTTYRSARRNAARTGIHGGIGPKILRRQDGLPRVHRAAIRVPPASGAREVGRRQRQIAAGALRRENGLAP